MRLFLLISSLGLVVSTMAQSTAADSMTSTADSSKSYSLYKAPVQSNDQMPILKGDLTTAISTLLIQDPLKFEDSKQDRSGLGYIQYYFQVKDQPRTKLNFFNPPFKSKEE